MSESLYDQNAYYDNDGKASRLSAVFNPLLWVLDAIKASRFYAKSGLKRGSKVLDVGAGDGKFLCFMRRLGATPFGTTASTCSQKAAKELYNIDLNYTLTLTGELAERTYDAITYWHVFEHLADPGEHVKQWSSLLNPGGIVMLEVPHVDGLGAKLCFDAWLGSDITHHINHMHAQDLIPMVKAAGFALLRQEGFSLKFSYVFLWSGLLGFLFGRRHYHFDEAFALLKRPFETIRKKPIMAINAILAIFYLMPFILLLLPIGLVCRRGEVLRLYFKKQDT